MSAAYKHPDGLMLPANDNALTSTDDNENMAEQAGAGIGTDCLRAVLAGQTQGERIRAIQSAILDLQRLAHPGRAAGGFAVALVNVLERGLGLCK